MKQATLFKVATQSILKNKMRTLLTMLGIVIGVGAVIVMVAVGQGAQSRIADRHVAEADLARLEPVEEEAAPEELALSASQSSAPPAHDSPYGGATA